MTKTYELDELIPNCNDDCIVYVFGNNYHFVSYGDNNGTTFRKVIDKAVMDRKAKYGSCYIIVEHALKGEIYQFGNQDRKVVYEHGTTKGYA